jgi:hypothetical protein
MGQSVQMDLNQVITESDLDALPYAILPDEIHGLMD